MALLPRQVRCPRPRCPQRLRPSLLLRLVASFCPNVADCSTTSGNTASPTKTSRLTAWRLPLAWRRPPSDWPATRSRDPLPQLRPTPQGRHRSGDRRPRPHQGRPDLRAQCRSLYVVPDPQEPPDAQSSRSAVPPTQVPAPVSLPDPSDLRLHACPNPDLVPFPVYVCLNGREWLARQMDQAKLHYVRRDNTFTWLEDLDQRRPCSTSRRRPTGRSCWTPAALAANPAQSGDPGAVSLQLLLVGQ